MAYRDFEDKGEPNSKKTSAYETVEKAVRRKLVKITKSDVAVLCLLLPISAIENAMTKMVAEGKPEKHVAREHIT